MILAGGSSCFEGLADRLKTEVLGLAHPGTEMRVKSDSKEERIGSVIKGASVFANLGTFNSAVITRAEFNETGPGIVNTKCP